MTPPIRRRPRPFLGDAQIAPVRVQRGTPVSSDLALTPYRKYLLTEALAGRIRWHQRLGWRLHATDQKPSAQNANVRDMVRAGWVTESGNAIHRELALTDAGRAHLPEVTP